jgi:hypothetical protein
LKSLGEPARDGRCDGKTGRKTNDVRQRAYDIGIPVKT